ncbi:MAG: KH domain-containing protein [Pseudanabaenaceae cyanobacterium]
MDYLDLTRFVLEPLLEQREALRIDCETAGQRRVWLRIAFAPGDRPRVLGRNGRTLQAIRRILTAAATLAGQELTLEVYDDGEDAGSRDKTRRKG